MKISIRKYVGDKIAKHFFYGFVGLILLLVSILYGKNSAAAKPYAIVGGIAGLLLLSFLFSIGFQSWLRCPKCGLNLNSVAKRMHSKSKKSRVSNCPGCGVSFDEELDLDDFNRGRPTPSNIMPSNQPRRWAWVVRISSIGLALICLVKFFGPNHPVFPWQADGCNTWQEWVFLLSLIAFICLAFIPWSRLRVAPGNRLKLALFLTAAAFCFIPIAVLAGPESATGPLTYFEWLFWVVWEVMIVLHVPIVMTINRSQQSDTRNDFS